MDVRLFARKGQGGVELDLCYACHAIWFDQYESAQLTPGAVIDLFRRIHEHHDQPPRPLGDRLRCPACRDKLLLTQDIQRTNRINYYRCANGHGRLTTFLQFLREKNFVRTLTAPEVAQLKVHVTQVRCSGCGAAVDLVRDSACGYCRSPISILDAEAVKTTLAELSAAERARHQVRDPDKVVAGMLGGGGQPAHATMGHGPPRRPALPGNTSQWGGGEGGGLVDLVGDALDFLMSD